MISEREFSIHYGSFWRDSLPNLESVTRSLNLATVTEWQPMAEVTNPARRDVIAETAFNVAALRFENPSMAYSEILKIAEKNAATQLGALRNRYVKEKILPLDAVEIDEVKQAQARIYDFGLRMKKWRGLHFRPTFSGHGFIHQCEGDLRSGRSIIELKYVSRNFRSSDFKQSLIYCCLDFFENGRNIDRIILVNPFRGIISEVDIDHLVNACGGVSFDEFAYKFSYHVCSGDVSR
jgi:hypothetical protein